MHSSTASSRVGILSPANLSLVTKETSKAHVYRSWISKVRELWWNPFMRLSFAQLNLDNIIKNKTGASMWYQFNPTLIRNSGIFMVLLLSEILHFLPNVRKVPKESPADCCNSIVQFWSDQHNNSCLLLFLFDLFVPLWPLWKLNVASRIIISVGIMLTQMSL